MAHQHIDIYVAFLEKPPSFRIMVRAGKATVRQDERIYSDNLLDSATVAGYFPTRSKVRFARERLWLPLYRQRSPPSPNLEIRSENEAVAGAALLPLPPINTEGN